MSEIKIELTPESVRDAVQVAVLGLLTPEKRDALIQEALKGLLAGTWTQPSELQRIFRQAAENVARGIAEQELQKPENVEKTRKLIEDAWAKVLGDGERDKLVRNLASNIAKAMTAERY